MERKEPAGEAHNRSSDQWVDRMESSKPRPFHAAFINLELSIFVNLKLFTITIIETATTLQSLSYSARARLGIRPYHELARNHT